MAGVHVDGCVDLWTFLVIMLECLVEVHCVLLFFLWQFTQAKKGGNSLRWSRLWCSYKPHNPLKKHIPENWTRPIHCNS